MRRCPITNALFEGDGLYSAEGLRLLSPKLQTLEPLPFTTQRLLEEAVARSTKMSIQGVQPKLSAVLDVPKGVFELVDQKGRYILKPAHPYFPNLPENEDLTMRLAATVGLEVPLHGLLYTESQDWCYFIRRFDRPSRNLKLAMEDMAQLTEKNRETKYRSSIEKIAKAVDAFCTFPAIEKQVLFRMVVLAFLTANGDMHLKNFSILVDAKGVRRLSPAYDQVNTRLAMGKAENEEMALSLNGKRNRMSAKDLMEHLATQVLALPPRIVGRMVGDFQKALPTWSDAIRNSFLDAERQETYLTIVRERAARLGWALEA